MAFATAVTVADLGRAAQARSGPLAPPLKGSGPLDDAAARIIVQIGVSDIKRRFTTGTTPSGESWRPLKYSRPNGGNKPLQDTGQMANSIAGRVETGAIVWFTAHPGAALHNFGGTVVPKKGKFLTIPLTREAKRAGSPRRMSVAKGARVPLFAKKIDGRMVGHFLCVKKTVDPAREFMGLSERALDAVGAALLESAAKNWAAG